MTTGRAVGLAIAGVMILIGGVFTSRGLATSRARP